MSLGPITTLSLMRPPPIPVCGEQGIDIRERHIPGQDNVISGNAIEVVGQPIADYHIIAGTTRDGDAGDTLGNVQSLHMIG